MRIGCFYEKYNTLRTNNISLTVFHGTLAGEFGHLIKIPGDEWAIKHEWESNFHLIPIPLVSHRSD